MAGRWIQSDLGLDPGDVLLPAPDNTDVPGNSVDDTAASIRDSAPHLDREVPEHGRTSVAMTRSLAGV